MSFLLQKRSVRLAAIVCTIGILQFFVSQVSAQLSITSTSAFTENFNSMGSSATASCPTGWRVGAATYSGAASAVTVAAGTSGTGALTGSSTGASYNFANGITASSTDRSLGNLTSSGYVSPKYVHLQVTNNTGSTVSGFTISFDYEKYRAGTRAFSMAFESGTDGSTYGSLWSDGAHSYAADAANAVVNPPTTESKSVTITGLTLANGSSYYLRWALIGSGGSTNGQGIGIDNFSITAIPACSTPTAYSVTGTGGYCAGGSGVVVGLANSQTGVSYQLYNGASTVGSPVAGTGSSISFGNQTTAATYTVLATVGTCTNAMTGSAVVTINSLPTISFTPTSPSFCDGSTGVGVTASGASTYTWSPATGLSATTGATVTANPSATTIYTVTGTSSSGCIGSGSVTVTENPLPTPTISGDVTITSVGSTILTFTGVDGDEVFYWNGASTVSTIIGASGTSTVSVSPATTTTYSVTSATSALGCSQSITGQTATVTVSADPTATISGSATICPGASTDLVFSGTAAATVYYSTDGATPLSVTLSGVSGIGSFTLSVTPSATTTYTLDSIVSGAFHGVIAGSATVTVSPFPTAYSVTGGGSYCAGTSGASIGLSNSQSGVDYQLYNGASPVGSPVAGTGSAISFGSFTTATTYTVVATNADGCSANMTGSAVVSINPAPTAYSVTGTGSYCTGGAGVAIGLANSETGINYQLYNGASTVGSPVAGTGSAISFGTFTTAATYTVLATNTTTSCTAAMTGSAVVTITSLPEAGSITGTTTVAFGSTTNLSNSGGDAGGVWSSSNTSVATVGTSGVVSGISGGTSIITYTVTNGCGSDIAIITVTVTGPAAVIMSCQTGLSYTEDFSDIANWTNGFASGIGANRWWPVAVIGSAAIPDATRTTVSSASFSTGTSGGVQRGTGTLIFLTTGTTNNSTSLAADFFMDFTGVNAGNVSFDAAQLANSTGDRQGTLRLYYSTNGTTFTELTGTGLPFVATNNVASSAAITVALPSAFNNSPTARLRFYYHNGPGGASGSRPKITVDNLNITATTTVAPITGTMSVCAGSTTTLSSVTSGGTWSSGTTGVATVGTSGIVSGVSAGTSVITYTVPNASGCSTFVTAVVTVNPLPTVTAIGGALTVCESSTTSLSNTTSGGVWSSSNTSVATIGTSGIVTGEAVGTSTISYVVTNGFSCTTTVSAVVTVNAIPSVATITGTLNVCASANTTLASATADGVWSSSTTGVATIGTGGVVNAVSAGTTTITYAVTNGFGCLTEVYAVVTVNPLPVVPAITGTAALCVGGNTTYANATPDGVWVSSNTTVATIGTTGVLSALAAGSTLVSYTVTNGFGCATTVTTSVTVRATPTAAPTNNGYICEGGTVTLTANPASGANTYTWSGSSLSATTSENPTATPTSTTVYSLTVSDGTSDAGCAPATVYTTSVTVNSTPYAVPTNSGPICNGGAVTLNSNGAGGATTYNWSGSSLSSSVVANPTATPTVTSVYSLTVTDGSTQPGCAPATVYTTSVTVNATPTAAPTNSGPICEGGTVTLTANPGGSATTYSWSGSNLSSTTVANPTATPTVTTVYSLTVTNGTSDAGCVPTTVYTTSVTVRPTPTAAPTNNGYICEGGTVTLTANPANGANTYTWSGSSLSATTTENPTATPTATTVYSLTVSDGTGDAGCAPATVYTTSVTVNSTPTAAPTNSSPICVGGTVTLTANGAGGATTYSWSGSSLSSSVVANPTATPTVTSVYSLTVSDGSSQPGCAPATVYTTSVTVNSTPTAAPTNSGPICVGGTVTLTANGAGGATNFSWSGSNLSSTTVANPTATPTVTTVYSLTVTNGTSDAGCAPTTVYTTSVTVRPTPTAAPTNNGYICEGGTVTLTANPANGANTYTWSGSSLSATTTENPTATPTATTVYSLNVSDGTSDAGCAPATVYTTSVTVNSTPTAAPSNSDPICNGGTVTLTANGAGGATTYNWSGSNLSSSVVANPTATPTVTSVYSLTVTDGSSQPGCAPATVYTTSVTVNSTPTAAPTNSGPICVGGTVTLTANGAGGATNFSWSGANLSSTIVANPTATPTVTTVYSLTVTNGTSDAGCAPTTVYTTSVTVRPTPTAAPTNNGYICVGGTVTLTANPANGANTYTWSGSSLSATTTENPTATPTATTVYSLTVSDGTGDAGCAPATLYTTSVTVNSTPTAAPSNSGPICNGGTVTLTANGAGGATTYNWSGSSLSSSVVANPTATPTSTSVYSLTVSDGSSQPGCSPATVYTTSVTVNSTPTAAPTNSGPICVGGTVTLTANGAGGATNFSWSGANLSSTTVANPTATPTVTSVYSLTVTNGTSDAGCAPTTVYTTSVTVRPTPTAAPTNNGYICEGGTVTLTANPANGANTFTWTGSSLSATTTENTTATPTATTVYSLTVSDGTGDAGCAPVTVYTTSVTVNSTPTAAPTNSSPICVGGIVTLTANGAGGATTYNWSGSNLSSSVVANPTATPTVTSVYSLTVSDGSSQPGCAPATVYTTSVTVNSTPTAAPTNSGPICVGGTVTLTANGAGGATNFSWSGANLSSTTVANPTATPTVTTIYSLTVTNGTSDAGCAPTTVYTTTVTVRPTPTAAPTNNGYICEGGTVTLTANPANGANTYTWSGSSLSATTTENPTATPTATTVYSLTVSDGTGDAGCAPATVYTTSVTVNSTPTAAPTNSSPICVGGTVTLTANGAGGATTYNWSGSNLSSSVVANPTATPTVTSVYSLTVSDGSSQPGCAPATVYTTSVTVNSTPTAAPTNSGPICVGGTVTLTANGAGGATNFSWSGSNLSSTSVANPTATPTVTTVYSLTFTNGTSDAGCAPTTVYTTTVTVRPTPTAAPTNNGYICVGGTVTLTANPANGANTYTWVGSSLSSTTVANPTATPTSTTVYSLTVSDGTADAGCAPATVYTTSVSVNATPTAAPTNSGPICVGGTVTLTANGAAGATTYNWSGSSLSSSVVANPTATPTVTSVYSLTVTDGSSQPGCSPATVYTTSVTVNSTPTAAPTNSSPICVGGTVTLTANPGGSTTTYSWSGPSLSSTTAANPTTTPTVTSVYSLTVTNGTSDAGCAPTNVYTTTVTVNPLPVVPAITGVFVSCEGGTTALSNTTSGGVWTSSATSVATVGTSGVVTAIAEGVTNITYSVTNGFGCNTEVSTTFTVNPLPTVAAITGTTTICETGTTTLASATTGGIWSSSTSAVAIVGTSGVLSGISAGNATISYAVTNGFGCTTVVTTIVTVNPLPTVIAITGPTGVCIGSTISYGSATTGGVWSISDEAIATINTSGEVTGTASGTANITYSVTNGFGCTTLSIATITVNPLPVVSAISGSTNLCIFSTTTLSNTTSGGIWSSGSTSIATIGSTGIVTGISAGTSIITYSVTSVFGCSTQVFTTITVNPLPIVPSISGTASLCRYDSTLLTNDTTGGVWSSGNISVATVSTSGFVTGVTAGNATITYTVTNSNGCSQLVTRIVTVNATPVLAAISGALNVCEGLTTSLSNTTAGGTWVSSNTSVATIGTSGIVNALTTGTTTISYTVTNGFSCSTTTTAIVTVNPLPTVASITGSTTVCAGATTTLSSVTTGGTWVSSNTSIATINTSGLVSGISAGTSTVTYTVTNGFGCITSVTAIVTVNPAPVVAAITGTINICENATSLLSNATADGVWTSSNTSVASVGTSGLVNGLTAGTTTVSYSVTNGFGCISSATNIVTVNPLPIVAAITGTFNVCISATTLLSNATTGGVWTSSNSSIATVSSSGVVSGVATGTTTITYSVSSAFSCTTIVTTSVTVNPLPVVGAITGPTFVCRDASVTFSDTTAGGVWTSNNPSIATVSSTGEVTGVSVGNTTITYTVTNSFGCSARAFKVITVYPLPVISSSTGSFVLCEGATRILNGSLPSGTWSSASPANASITSLTGVVSGLSAGTALISFQITATGCADTAVVTINPKPVISGINFVCAGNITQLSSSISGGTWTSSNPTMASINATTGLINGVSVGTANVTYTIPTGCFSVVQVTVNTAVPNITGPENVCLGSTANLVHPVSGGTWVSSNLTNATISTTGVVSGLNVGTTTISYLLEEGCYATRTTSVSPLPNPIIGNTSLCVGSSTYLSNSVSGTWSSSNPAVHIRVGNGLTTGVSLGNAIITFRATATGCFVTREATVNPLPAPITGGGSAFCAPTSITLSSTTPGGVWSSFNPSVVSVDSLSGVATAYTTSFTGLSVTHIYYTLPTGCFSSAIVTVNPSPSAIYGGSQSLCLGESTTMLHSSALGTWSSATPAVAVVSSTGLVTSVSVGTSIISYTNSYGCSSTRSVTVNGTLAANSGTFSLCNGQSTVLTNATPGGTWSSANNSVATINSVTGIMTGIGAGTTTISYRIGVSCFSVSTVTVNSSVASFSGIPSVCVGTTTNLSYPVTGGTWSSTNTSVATVGATGEVTGVATGSTTISYIFGAGCYKTITVTVHALPTPITGTPLVCAGANTLLLSTGGTWSSSNTSVATINSSGRLYGISSGTSVITYRTTSTGCYSTVVATVNQLPVIATPAPFCSRTTTTLTATPSGGTWSLFSSALVTIDSATGFVDAFALVYSIPSVTTVKYTSLNGCSANKVITVNPIPSVLHGSTGVVCVGGNATYLSGTTGGTWSTANTDIAAIVSGGTIIGVASGTTIVSYTNSYGCANTASVTVYPVPGANIGATTICAGQSTIFTNSTGFGTWSTTDFAKINVNTTTGLVTGVNIGSATVTYRLNPTCYSVSNITVTPGIGAIIGPNTLCIGAAITYTNPAVGGTWESSNPSVATVNSSGVVSAVGMGTTTITYTTSLCSSTKIVTVNCASRPLEDIHQQSVVTIYPNPLAGDMFTIQSTTVGTLTVYALDGKMISTYSVSDGTTQLSLPHETVSGIYIARFTDNLGNVTTLRIVLNK